MAKKLAPIHPGEILREEFMKPHGLSQTKLAAARQVAGEHRISRGLRARDTE